VADEVRQAVQTQVPEVVEVLVHIGPAQRHRVC
jgi:hypothetical protein